MKLARLRVDRTMYSMAVTKTRARNRYHRPFHAAWSPTVLALYGIRGGDPASATLSYIVASKVAEQILLAADRWLRSARKYGDHSPIFAEVVRTACPGLESDTTLRYHLKGDEICRSFERWNLRI